MYWLLRSDLWDALPQWLEVGVDQGHLPDVGGAYPDCFLKPLPRSFEVAELACVASQIIRDDLGWTTGLRFEGAAKPPLRTIHSRVWGGVQGFWGARDWSVEDHEWWG